MPLAQTIFAHHPRAWRENRYVYPVVSRRSGGLSIGVNVNPDKVCNFDCVYCCVDRTAQAVVQKVELEVLATELDQMLTFATTGGIYREGPFGETPAPLRILRDVAISGDGEPTSFSRFGDACHIVAELLARRRLADVKIVLITNATLLHRPSVKAALALLDEHNGEVWAKMDAGSEAYYRLVERTTVRFERILENILNTGRARPIVLQSLFMRLHDQPPPAEEIDAYLERLRGLIRAGSQIKQVQVYTTARKTRESYVSPLEERLLHTIAERVRGLGLSAECYPAPR